MPLDSVFVAARISIVSRSTVAGLALKSDKKCRKRRDKAQRTIKNTIEAWEYVGITSSNLYLRRVAVHRSKS